MPSVEPHEDKDHYMHRCVPMLVKEGKKQDQAVAQCINMFKEKWQASGKQLPPDYSEAFFEILANFHWSDCPECAEREKSSN